MGNAISLKMKSFVLEFLLDGNQRQAAIRAGCAEKSAHKTAGRWMQHPGVKKLIAKLEQKTQEEFEIQRHEILYHLHAMATRDSRDLVDAKGKLLDPAELKKLPDSIGLAIDGIKQKVLRRTTDEDGTIEEIIETEVKLVSKASAVDMAMRHKGLFDADKDNAQTLVIDFDKLVLDQRKTIDVDPLEQRLLEEERDR